VGGASRDNFSIFNPSSIQAAVSSTVSTFTLLLGAVAAISLLVGGTSEVRPVPAPEQPPHDEPVVQADFIEPVEPVDDDLFDESWEAQRKTNRLTVVLVVALLVVAGFAGGVLVQKHHVTALAAAAAGAGAPSRRCDRRRNRRGPRAGRAGDRGARQCGHAGRRRHGPDGRRERHRHERHRHRDRRRLTTAGPPGFSGIVERDAR
jgi:hypothetical protein